VLTAYEIDPCSRAPGQRGSRPHLCGWSGRSRTVRSAGRESSS